MTKGESSSNSGSVPYADVLLELSPNLVFFLDPENDILGMSKTAREAFGLSSKDACIGKNIYEIVKNPVLVLLIKRWFEKMNQGMEIDEVFPLENRESGVYQWWHIRGAHTAQDGKLIGKVFYITDVTELNSQKKILDTLMGALPGDVLVFSRAMRVLLVSDSIARASGFYSWRAALGRSVSELHYFDSSQLERMIDRVILSGEPIHEVMKFTEGGKDARWYLVDLRTIPSTAGTFGYILTRFDITGEIKPKVILEALMESATDSIVIVDPKGTVQYASRSLVEALGFSSWHSVINREWEHLFAYDPNAAEKFSVLFTGDGERSRTGTLNLDGIGGKVFYNYRLDPLRYQNANFGVIAIASNATELVSARNKAESAVRAKAAFLANMSHELRTPMNAVLGMNELLSRTALSALQQNYVTQIRSSATLLLSIINDILDFSRIEDRKLELLEAPYDFVSLLQDVINLVSVKVAEKELCFTVDIDPRLPAELSGDEIRIKQILINLLNNAVKFTAKGLVHLSVSAGLSSGFSVPVSFAVRDTGIGIPKEKQSELFERFSRIESAGSMQVEGSGLGLSICKGLVGLMGGSLTVQSEDGEGSVFTAVVNQRKTGKDALIARFPNPEGISLLIFDRHPAVRESLMKMAGYAGVRAVTCLSFDDFSRELAARDKKYTHIVFEYQGAYAACVAEVKQRPDARWLALLTLTDFIGKGKDPAIAFVFKPLLISVFARFLSGTSVDFSVSLPLSNTLGVSTAFFRAVGVKVLVVDDNAVNRKVAEGFLKTLDIQVDEASGGEDAIQKAGKTAYDLILLDHLMPDMDGIAALEKLRAIKGYADTPVLALTANNHPEWIEKYRSAGFNDILFKPIDFTAFVTCLKRWLPESKSISAPEPAVEQGYVPVQGTVPEPVAVTVTKPAQGDWIRGLDREEGLKYTGSQKNLDMVLGVFNRTGKKMLEQLESGRYSSDTARFRTAAHSLISSCGNIGAKDLSANASRLEEAIISGDTDAVNRIYPLVHAELKDITANVAEFLGDKK